MYKFLKMLQLSAEQIGDISEVRVSQKGPYTDDEVRFEGYTAEGRPFRLALIIREKENDS